MEDLKYKIEMAIVEAENEDDKRYSDTILAGYVTGLKHALMFIEDYESEVK